MRGAILQTLVAFEFRIGVAVLEQGVVRAEPEDATGVEEGQTVAVFLHPLLW